MSKRLAARRQIGECLKEQAAWVHRELEEADALDLPMPEEALTTFVLKAMKRDLGSDLFRLTVYSKQVEGRSTGADWEWWFGDGVNTPYIGARVQAKKLHHSGGVPEYDFSHATKKLKKLQIETLRSAAAQAGIPALYALYNGGFELSEFTWNCCAVPSRELFGVSVISADVVEDLRSAGTTTLADVGPSSRPWSCLMLCPNWLAQDVVPTPFAEPAGALLTYAADLIGGLVGAQFGAGLGEFDIESAAANSTVTAAVRSWDELPQYVRTLAMQDPERESVELTRSVELGGVAVFSSRARTADFVEPDLDF